jgi:hypothetical protein
MFGSRRAIDRHADPDRATGGETDLGGERRGDHRLALTRARFLGHRVVDVLGVERGENRTVFAVRDGRLDESHSRP